MSLDIRDSELTTAPRAARSHLLKYRLSPYLLIHPALRPAFADLVTDSPTAVRLGGDESKITRAGAEVLADVNAAVASARDAARGPNRARKRAAGEQDGKDL